MPDMLVNLRNIPEPLVSDEVIVRRANTWDKNFVHAWVTKHFSASWAHCCDVGFEQRPVTVFVVAERAAPGHNQETLLGFACYDVAAKGVFGPMGVEQTLRKKGLGAAVLVGTLHAMRSEGYGYAIIGQVGPADFYTKVVGATLIAGSDPGTARTFLKS